MQTGVIVSRETRRLSTNVFNIHCNARLEASLEADMKSFKMTWDWLVQRSSPPMLSAMFQGYLLVRRFRGKEEKKDKDNTLYGDALMQHLWYHQTDTTFDVKITDTDTKSYISKLLEKVLLAQEKERRP
eukprot:15340945-Ditylum_brightwellii.AAC.1